MPSVTVMFGEQKLSTHIMTHTPFVVGRESTCDIVIDNVGISREHCQFIWDGKHYYIEDLDSSNGTYHHGQRIRKAPLGTKESIQIGKHTLIFSCSPGEPPPSPKKKDAAPARKEKAAPLTDGMLTFTMDARLIHQHICKASGPQQVPQRASDLARSMGGSAPASCRGGSIGARLAKVLALLVTLGVLAGAAYYILTYFGYLGTPR